MTQKISSPAEAIEFVLVQPHQELVDVSADNLNAFKKDIALQVQGEAVEFIDGLPTLSAAYAFALVCDIASEAILRLDDGRLFQLFKHHDKEVIYSEKIDETIWQAIVKAKKQLTLVMDVANPFPETVIDLSEIWRGVMAGDDLIASTKLFINYFFANLKPSVKICLRGEIPNLALFAAIYLARPCAYSIVFGDARGKRVTLFADK